jgi:hypothetical protein
VILILANASAFAISTLAVDKRAPHKSGGLGSAVFLALASMGLVGARTDSRGQSPLSAD